MLLAVAAAPAAGEPCKMGRAGVLPVTMEDMQPLVHAAINGRDALFLADSGAFFSMLSTAGARQFNLTLQHVNHNLTVHGVGGAAQVWMTTVQTFTLFNLDLPKVPFLVTDNDMGHGAIGVLGQNVFQLGDIEYDLANGVINILRTKGDCRQTSLAYWAHDKGVPYSEIDIDFARAENPRLCGRPQDSIRIGYRCQCFRPDTRRRQARRRHSRQPRGLRGRLDVRYRPSYGPHLDRAVRELQDRR
jgi:hypothetical protein